MHLDALGANEYEPGDSSGEVVVEGAGGKDVDTGLHQSILEHFRAQHQERAVRFLAELMTELDEDGRQQVVGHEREIIATAIEQALKGFTEGGGLGLSFEQMLRRTLSEILRTSYNVKIAVYRAYKASAGSLRKGPSHNDQLLRNGELVDAVDLAKKSVELRRLVLGNTGILLNSKFPAEAFCVEDRADLKVSARQISDLVDNFYLWFLDQFPEKAALVGYLYVFGGFDADAVCARVKTFEEKDFAPKEGEVPPEGHELMGSYGLDAVAIEASYARIKAAFEISGETYLARFLDEVSLQDTDSLDLIENWREIRRHRDEVFAPVFQDSGKKSGRRPLGMELSAMNLDRVEKMQIVIPETELAICLDEMNLMRLQRGNLSARNKVLLRLSRLIGSMCRKGYAFYWLKKAALSDAVLDLEQEVSLKLMEKIAMYDPTKCRFLTYMRGWIKAALGKVILKETLVPLSVWVHQVLNYCRRHPESSDQEVVDHFRSINMAVSLKAISRLRSSDFSMLNLDAPVARHDPEGDSKNQKTIGDLIVVSQLDRQDLPSAMKAYRMAIVHRMFAMLPPRHAYILMQRYVYGRELQEIADEIGISRQAVEQLGLYALESLRAHTVMGDLIVDRTKQRGARGNKAERVDRKLAHNVFLIFDDAKWQNWCEAQTDITTEQMLWFRLYLGLEQSNAFGRLDAGTIRRSRKNVNLAQFYRVTRLLRDRLQRDLAALPEGRRFVRSFTKYEMFKNAGALLDFLQIAA